MPTQTPITPQVLRRNAMQNLSDARRLLPTSSKNAKYLAGYAVEFALKARYCMKRGWTTFPASVQDLKARNKDEGVEMDGKLFIHDLEALLRLSESVYMTPASFASIDWARVCDWSEQIRYDPVETVSADEANDYVQEVGEVVDYLFLCALLDQLRIICRELTAAWGLFNIYAYVDGKTVEGVDSDGWVLFASWAARSEGEHDARRAELHRLVNERVDPTLAGNITGVVTAPGDRGQPEAVSRLLRVLELDGQVASGTVYMNAWEYETMTLPRGYYMVSGFRSRGDVEASWADATALQR